MATKEFSLRKYRKKIRYFEIWNFLALILKDFRKRNSVKQNSIHFGKREP